MKDTTYFRRNYNPKAKYKFIMQLNDFICEVNMSRKKAKKYAVNRRMEYGI